MHSPKRSPHIRRGHGVAVGHSEKEPSATMAQRLNKAIAAAGFCSRRKADELIFAGHVTVNNQEERNPARQVLPEDRICVDGRCLERKQPFLYYLLHKPVQVASA